MIRKRGQRRKESKDKLESKEERRESKEEKGWVRMKWESNIANWKARWKMESCDERWWIYRKGEREGWMEGQTSGWISYKDHTLGAKGGIEWMTPHLCPYLLTPFHGSDPRKSTLVQGPFHHFYTGYYWTCTRVHNSSYSCEQNHGDDHLAPPPTDLHNLFLVPHSLPQ